jgi:hypothetical protein
MSKKRDIDNLRALLLLSGATLAIGVFLSFQMTLGTEDQQQFREANGIDAIATAATSVYLWLSWLALYVLAHVLAFSLVWFSRYLFVVSFAIEIVMAAVGGLMVITPLENAVWAVHTMLATFAIGMLFFSPGVRSGTRKDYAATSGKPPLSGASRPATSTPDAT